MQRVIGFALIGLCGAAVSTTTWAEPPPLVVETAVKSCEGGAIADCARLGSAYRMGTENVKQDIAKAQHFFERACSLGQGRVRACVELADILNSGLNGKRDTLGGLTVLERACGGREASACAYLGLIYTEGLGVPYRPEQQRIGFGFYQKACDLGSAKGCWHLGLLLRAGIGCEKNLAAAKKFLEKACHDGESVACTDLKEGTIR